MSLSDHLMETEADLEVKRTAWRGTEARLKVWAKQYSDACALTEGKKKTQVAILNDAEREMFSRSTVKGMGLRLHKMELASPKVQARLLSEISEISEIKTNYANRIGLGKALR